MAHNLNCTIKLLSCHYLLSHPYYPYQYLTISAVIVSKYIAKFEAEISFLSRKRNAQHLTRVKMVAQALQDKTTLSGDEVLRIIEEAAAASTETTTASTDSEA